MKYCRCITTNNKSFPVFGCEVVTLFVVLILGLLCSTSKGETVKSKEKPFDFEKWIRSPTFMYIEIKMFNWTNSHEVFNPNVKPSFTEVGPYVFSEIHKRTNIRWNRNGTVTFNRMRTWKFLPDISNGTLDDKITNLNVVSSAVAYKARNKHFTEKIMAHIILAIRGSLVVTKTVGELLFDGYEDTLSDFINKSYHKLRLPFDRFSWFVNRNDSWSYDGEFNINTGKDDKSKMGELYLWNGKTTSGFYSKGCSKINGTTGALWSPELNPQEDISLFINEIGRSISLAPVTDLKHSKREMKWIGDARVFDNGENFPPNMCFCTGLKCPDFKSGVLNVSDCQFGLPTFVSYPHFYLADPSYRDAINGMNPNRQKHEFSITLEPNFGIPLLVNERFQINIFLQKLFDLSFYRRVPSVMIPMFWFDRSFKRDSIK